MCIDLSFHFALVAISPFIFSKNVFHLHFIIINAYFLKIYFILANLLMSSCFGWFYSLFVSLSQDLFISFIFPSSRGFWFFFFSNNLFVLIFMSFLLVTLSLFSFPLCKFLY